MLGSSFSTCVCVHAQSLNHVWLSVTPQTVAHQTPLSGTLLWDSPGKNTGVGCHFLLQGIFPTQGSNPGLLHCRQSFDLWTAREAMEHSSWWKPACLLLNVVRLDTGCLFWDNFGIHGYNPINPQILWRWCQGMWVSLGACLDNNSDTQVLMSLKEKNQLPARFVTAQNELQEIKPVWNSLVVQW